MSVELVRCPKCGTDAPVMTLADERPRVGDHKRPNGSWCAEGTGLRLDRIPENPPSPPEWVK